MRAKSPNEREIEKQAVDQLSLHLRDEKRNLLYWAAFLGVGGAVAWLICEAATSPDSLKARAPHLTLEFIAHVGQAALVAAVLLAFVEYRLHASRQRREELSKRNVFKGVFDALTDDTITEELIRQVINCEFLYQDQSYTLRLENDPKNADLLRGTCHSQQRVYNTTTSKKRFDGRLEVSAVTMKLSDLDNPPASPLQQLLVELEGHPTPEIRYSPTPSPRAPNLGQCTYVPSDSGFAIKFSVELEPGQYFQWSYDYILPFRRWDSANLIVRRPSKNLTFRLEIPGALNHTIAPHIGHGTSESRFKLTPSAGGSQATLEGGVLPGQGLGASWWPSSRDPASSGES